MSRISVQRVSNAMVAAVVLLSACTAGPPPVKDAPAQRRSAAPFTAPKVGDEALAVHVATPAKPPVHEPVATPPAQATAPPPPDPAAQRALALQQTLAGWQQAWQQRDLPAYLRFYDARYKGDAGSRQAWEKGRGARFAGAPITVAISDVRWVAVNEGEAEVRFLQHYTQGDYQDVGEKTLRLRRIDGDWRITQERWRRSNGKG